MHEATGDATIRVPRWVKVACKWFWRKRGWLFGTLIFGGLYNLAIALVLVDPSTLHLLPIAWGYEHWSVPVGIFIALCILTIFCGLVSRLAGQLSPRESKRRYLKRLEAEMRMARLTGIPAGLIAQSVPLDEIFIPAYLRRNRPRADYPLTDRELELYRQRLKGGSFPKDLDRVVMEAEKNWYRLISQHDRISMADFWAQLGQARVAVVQGYPGMGKSTLMERLALHMARRSLHIPDPEMPDAKQFTPVLLPILLRLGHYATARAGTVGLTLQAYLEQELEQLHIPGLVSVIGATLQDGHCFVLLDGLDEVSEIQMRQEVQEAIKLFISEYGSGAQEPGNRFIITSRVAGYDQAAFPDYDHYTLTELSRQQINEFLPRWCRATLRRDHGLTETQKEHEALRGEIERKTQELRAAIAENQGVAELATNPLLLTLLAVMQQNSIALPRGRVELYSVVTRTLLENRNIAKKLEPIAENLAVQRLGPLAFVMQETGNSFARQQEVMDALYATIRTEGGTEAEIQQEAEKFLQRMRERGGLFVLRAGDYFGFLHRTFQEYFVARYLLNQIRLDQQRWIDELIGRVRKDKALWREPFLLAVAYQSKENERLANTIVERLLDCSAGPSAQTQERDLRLAITCAIEAERLDSSLEKRIAAGLLQCYHQAQREQREKVCQEFEALTERWLLRLSKDAYQPALPLALYAAICDSSDLALQRSTLRLLAMIIGRLLACQYDLFSLLIPPLLALAGLPAVVSPVVSYQPLAGLSSHNHYDLADLALTILSFMGKRGPAGTLLPVVRQHFAEHPAHLYTLARYSLECGMLLTPVAIPLENTHYEKYKLLIKEWYVLLRSLRQKHSHRGMNATEQEVEACLKIHQGLLEVAEVVRYPSSDYFLYLAQLMIPDARSWQQAWQDFLIDQFKNCVYIRYQEIALLWILFFSQHENLIPLATLLSNDYQQTQSSRQTYALCLLASVARDLSDLKGLSDWRDLGYLMDWGYLSDLRSWRDLSDLSDLRYSSDSSDLRASRASRALRASRSLRDRRYLRGLRVLRDLRALRALSDFAFAKKNIQKSLDNLNIATDWEKSLLLNILMGRLLFIQQKNVAGEEIEQEVQSLSEAALQCYAQAEPTEIELRESALDVVYSIPTRTANEIAYVLQLAHGHQETEIQWACVVALERARPLDEAAWVALEQGQNSPIAEVRKAVNERMEARQKQPSR